jgi:hypothetical protein
LGWKDHYVKVRQNSSLAGHLIANPFAGATLVALVAFAGPATIVRAADLTSLILSKSGGPTMNAASDTIANYGMKDVGASAFSGPGYVSADMTPAIASASQNGGTTGPEVRMDAVQGSGSPLVPEAAPLGIAGFAGLGLLNRRRRPANK